ncbi:MAG: TIGR03936 family radical SAM-associated protein, partial [Sedimentisphaerales bacterium]
MLIKFKVRDNLRFLSHAETVKVFQRACIRAGIKIQYSQGFNPRPKLYLPLPRSVGVETDDDLLCLRVNLSGPRTVSDESQIKAGLAKQLPDGVELLSVTTVPALTEIASSPQQQRAKTLPQAIAAT